MFCAHVTENQAKALEDCKTEVSCEVYNLNYFLTFKMALYFSYLHSNETC